MLHASTRVETPDGARAVETLKAGDRVLTQTGEAALEAVSGIVLTRSEWAYSPGVWPLRVPVGTLGNLCPFRMSPGMRVLLPGEGQVFALIADLVGIGGVARDRPLADIRYYELRLADHALIRAEGALCETAPVGPRAVHVPASRIDARAAFGRVTGRVGG